MCVCACDLKLNSHSRSDASDSEGLSTLSMLTPLLSQNSHGGDGLYRPRERRNMQYLRGKSPHAAFLHRFLLFESLSPCRSLVPTHMQRALVTQIILSFHFCTGQGVSHHPLLFIRQIPVQVHWTAQPCGLCGLSQRPQGAWRGGEKVDIVDAILSVLSSKDCVLHRCPPFGFSL